MQSNVERKKAASATAVRPITDQWPVSANWDIVTQEVLAQSARRTEFILGGEIVGYAHHEKFQQLCREENIQVTADVGYQVLARPEICVMARFDLSQFCTMADIVQVRHLRTLIGHQGLRDALVMVRKPAVTPIRGRT